MKTILLVQDETTCATRLLPDAVPTKIPVREIEAVAGCNCDRWGHPCPRCVERNVEPEVGHPALSLAQQRKTR